MACDVRNVSLIDLPVHGDERGFLVAVEAGGDIPFSVNRVYYIWGVDESARRGFHAHRHLEQLLVCVHGSIDILVDDGVHRDVVRLSDPGQGLYVGNMVWREMFDFQDDGVLMVLASEHYQPDDYITDYDAFCQEAAAWNSSERIEAE